MQEFKLPQLPEGYRWGAEATVPFSEEGLFEAPDGMAIKKIDIEKKIVICVAFQRYVEEMKTWVTLSTQS